MTPRRVAALLGAVLASFAARAEAATLRPRFEPTDLELEKPGVLDVDVQVGATSGDGALGRFYAPDYEIDLGLTRRLELDIDGAFAVEPLRGGRAGLAIGEPLWTSVKIGLFDLGDAGTVHTAAAGLQLGPRLPLGAGFRGVGYGALALAAVDFGKASLVLQAGALLDPETPSVKKHALGFVGGVDARIALDPAGSFAFVGELAGGHYLSVLSDQVTVTGGVSWTTGAVEWSLVSLLAPIGTSDRAGLLLGCSPRLRLF